MDSNVKDGSNYLDGVPVKISAKFVPPRIVPLPFAFDDNPNTDVLNYTYDFSLEKSIIENHTRRLLQLEEAQAKPRTECASSESAEAGSSHESRNEYPTTWKSDAVLQPQQPLDKILSEDSPQDGHVKINLSDFENETSSPFDYMELQTINDLEVLNSVFQGIHSSNPQEETSSCATNGIETPTNVSKSKSFPFPSKDMEGAYNSNSVGRDFGRGSLPTSSYTMPCMISDFAAAKRVEDFPSDSYLKLSQVPYISSNSGACARPTIARVPSLLRGSKSYSDISTLSNIEDTHYEKERSRTPPSTFSYSTNQEAKHSYKEEAASRNGLCDSALPDPYNELENDAKEFVNSIAEMGFSRPQVARTVKHLGTDEKKVVEHLCQIQALEESGYEGLEAEAALHLHDYNRDEAKMFLDLVSQFQDLGFEKNAVKKALVQNKNDWNKTIDALLL